MTIARNKQICLTSTRYYHCANSCVKRAYLCGFDPHTQKNLDHRREWFDEILQKLTTAFCIDVAALSITSNRYRLLVKINADQVSTLSDIEIIDRWNKIYSIPTYADYYRRGYTLTESQEKNLASDILLWRSELANLSRFMGYLNEKIARRANKEDACTGRFWESRFKSNAVKDAEVLLRTMLYADQVQPKQMLLRNF